jgi:nicotinate-nucleotide adenylyltransferase
VDAVPMPALEVSSTDLRARVRAGRTTEVLIPDAVRTRIEVHGLYR